MLAYEKQRIVRKISLMVRMGSNPYGSRPNFFGQQKFAFDEGSKFSAGDSAENLIDGADREQSPPSRLGIVSES